MEYYVTENYMYLMIMVMVASLAGDISAPEAIEPFKSLDDCQRSLLKISKIPEFEMRVGKTTGYFVQGKLKGEVTRLFCVKNSISI